MKTKIFLFSLSAFVMPLAIFGQWIQQSPYPTSNHLSDIQFTDENTGVAVGDKGTIIRTQDGGTSWSHIESRVKKHFQDIDFVNETVGLIVGDSGTILRTIDGGLTWAEHSITDSMTLRTVSMVDESNAWIVGGSGQTGCIYRTEDGGVTWSLQYMVNKHQFNCIDFTDPSNGWAACNHGIIHTNDGGNNWEIQLCDYWLNLNSIFFLDSLRGWSVGSGEGGLILHTSDGGTTWQKDTLDIADYFHFDNIVFTTGRNGYISGWVNYMDHQSAVFFRTKDGGITWSGSQLPISQPLNGIFFINEDKGWVAGDYGTIMLSENGGKDWNSKSLPTNDLEISDVCFLDDSTGWALGNIPYLYQQGRILHTSNGGREWKIYDGTNLWLKKIFFSDKTNGWILKNHGIDRTWNGGLTWESLSFPGVFNENLFFHDPDNGWMVGMNPAAQSGYIYHTPDGGNTWDLQYENEGEFFSDVIFSDMNNGWAAGRTGDSGIILRTTTGGQTWAINLYAENQNFIRIFFTDASNGRVVGSNGAVFQTGDGGKTWSQSNPGFNVEITDAYTTDLQHMWAIGKKGQYPDQVICGLIYYSDDGGHHWLEQASGINSELSGIWFNKNKDGWIVGNDGTILLTNNGGMTGIVDPPAISEKSSFRVICYPNPFSNTVNIEFYLEEPGTYEMTILDHLGKITDRITGAGQAGRNLTVYQTGVLTPGIYFCRIVNKNHIETVKMVKR